MTEGWEGMMTCPGCGAVLPFIWTERMRWDGEQFVSAERNVPDPFWFTGPEDHQLGCPARDGDL